MAEPERKTSAQAVLLFLKAAGLEPQWTTDYAIQALGIDQATAKEVTAELALMGNAELVKRDTWRNTLAGNKFAGVRRAASRPYNRQVLMLSDDYDRLEVTFLNFS
jgi:hypothetical protein